MLARQDVQVQVEDGLSALAPGVYHQAVAAFLAHGSQRHLARRQQQPPGQVSVFVRQRVHGGDMPAGDHQQVQRSQGVDIADDDEIPVCIDQVSGEGIGYDLTENAVIHLVLVATFLPEFALIIVSDFGFSTVESCGVAQG